MEKQFENFKAFITEKGKQAKACKEEYTRVLKSENYQELLQVIKDNYNWCFNNSIFTKEELIKLVPNEILLENGFYYDYTGVIDGDKTVFLYDSTIQNVRGNATIQDVRGNATIQNVWDNATIQNVRDNGKYFKYEYGCKPKLFMRKDAFEIVEI